MTEPTSTGSSSKSMLDCVALNSQFRSRSTLSRSFCSDAARFSRASVALPGSSSTRRSSNEGYSRSRESASAIGGGGGVGGVGRRRRLHQGGVERDHAGVEQRDLGLVGGEHALAHAVPGAARLLAPIGGTCQP